MLGTEWIYQLRDKVTGPLAGINNALSATDRAAQRTESSINNIGNSANGLTTTFKAMTGVALTAIAAMSVQEIGREIYDAGTKFETLNNVINYTSVNAKDAAENHAFLKRIISEYKLPVLETTDGFSQFNAALMGSALAGDAARKIYEGVSVGVTAMHLSAAQANQVFMALNQMVSKGTVQSQELKLQLGNALPGAFQLAARAMNMTTAEFTKMLDSGKVMAVDFLPKFAKQMMDTYSGAIPAAIQSTIAKETEWVNKSLLLKEKLFHALQPIINSYYSFAVDVLGKVEIALKVVYNILSPVVSFMWEMRDVIGALIAAYAGYRVGLALTTAWQMVNYAWMMKSVIAESLLATYTNILTVAQHGLNAALWANPIGIVIGLLASAAFIFYQLWQRSETFRAALYGLWEAAKVVGSSLFTIFKAVGKVILGALTLNVDTLMSGINDIQKVGFEIGKAYATGQQKGIASFKADKEKDKEGSSVMSMVPGGEATKTTTTTNTTGGSTGAGSGSGSGSRNITTTIQRLGEVTINVYGGGVDDIRKQAPQIRKLIHETLIGGVRDFEVAISSGG